MIITNLEIEKSQATYTPSRTMDLLMGILKYLAPRFFRTSFVVLCFSLAIFLVLTLLGYNYIEMNRNRNQVEIILGPYIKDKKSSIAEKTSKMDLMLYTKTMQFFKRGKYVNIINCRSIFDGNSTELQRAKNISKRYSQNITTPLDYIEMTKDCERFIKERRYITHWLTEEEKKFPISFSIVMYTDVERFERLLRSIYRPQNIYCIHVDSKASSYVFQAVSGIAKCFDNVFTSRRVNVKWGTFSVLLPELICMQELTNTEHKWKYYIKLTGQEFPLKTNAEIVQILKAYNGTSDVESYFTRGREQLRRLKGAGEPPHGVIPMKGSIHLVVARDFVNYVLNDQTALDILNWTRHTLHSEEMFFATLVGNRFLNVPSAKSSGERQHGIHTAARYLVWYGGKCGGKFIRSVCIFGIRDIPLLATRYELFVNKFLMYYYPLAYDCMEELIFNRTRDQYLGEFNFNTTRYIDGGYLQ